MGSTYIIMAEYTFTFSMLNRLSCLLFTVLLVVYDIFVLFFTHMEFWLNWLMLVLSIYVVVVLRNVFF